MPGPIPGLNRDARADRSGLTPTRAARIVTHYFVRTDAGIGSAGIVDMGLARVWPAAFVLVERGIDRGWVGRERCRQIDTPNFPAVSRPQASGMGRMTHAQMSSCPRRNEQPWHNGVPTAGI
jgi:hypothetical protein